jgi:hypothetical protein
MQMKRSRASISKTRPLSSLKTRYTKVVAAIYLARSLRSDVESKLGDPTDTATTQIVSLGMGTSTPGKRYGTVVFTWESMC